MKIIVDVERCQGAGQCALTAPDVFDQTDDDGTVVVLNEEPPAELHDAVRKATVLCPNSVIRLVDS